MSSHVRHFISPPFQDGGRLFQNGDFSSSMFSTVQAKLLVVPNFWTLNLINYEMFNKIRGGNFVDSTKINLDTDRKLW